jgi:hypothetical protein
MADAGAQRTNYSSKAGENGHSKVISSGGLSGASAGSKSGDGSGPTGSSRSYPKGGKVNMTPDFNPQKCKATDIYVGGVS